MIDSIKKKWITKDNIIILAQVLIFYRIVLNLIYSTEQPYQMQKDIYFAISAMWFMLLVFALRKIPFSRIAVWISLGGEAVFLVTFFLVRKINTARYGNVYFSLILIYWIICALFIALIVDFLCSGSVKEAIAKKWAILALFVPVSIFMFIYEGSSAIPVALPIIAFLLTNLTKDRWVMLVNCFAVGYYLAFAQTMTKSLIQNPDRYQSGRYLGSFMELESGGAFCGGAVVCMLYFIALFIITEREKWYRLAIPLLLILYPIYAVVRITSRSTQVSLIMVTFFFFAFIHKSKEKKTTVTRIVIAVGASILIVATLLFVSAGINKRIEADSDIELSYWEKHLAPLTSQSGRTGYFEEGSILNPIDRLSSRRLAHWVESAKQIRLWGHPYEPFNFPGNEIATLSSHNFFIEWLIEYGIIGGGLVIAWALFIAVKSILKMLRHDEQAAMTFLWVFYSMGIFNFTCLRWKSPITFGFLLLQYALIVGNRELGEKSEHGTQIADRK